MLTGIDMSSTLPESNVCLPAPREKRVAVMDEVRRRACRKRTSTESNSFQTICVIQAPLGGHARCAT